MNLLKPRSKHIKLTNLDESDKKRLALTKMFQKYADNDYRLFHLTVTYRSYKDHIYSHMTTNIFFVHFYLRAFLPALLKTRNIHLKKHRSAQPICYAFLDEHEPVPDLDHPEVLFSERLHHHSILAVKQQQCQKMSELCGINNIPLKNRYAKKVMTTHMRECEARTTLYATKCLYKYPDFLCFPDRLH